MRQGLPNGDLRLIWTLADRTSDGRLDPHEFAVAQFLIRRRLAGGALPEALPAELLPPPPPSSAAGGGATAAGMGAQELFPPSAPVTPLLSVNPSPAAQPSPRVRSLPFPSQPPPLHAAPPSPAPAPAPAAAPAGHEDPFAAIYASNNTGPAPPPADDEWGMGGEEAARYGAAFEQADGDRDGYVTGLEARPILAGFGPGLAKADLRLVRPAPPPSLAPRS